jgi:hypothetical protein
MTGLVRRATALALLATLACDHVRPPLDPPDDPPVLPSTAAIVSEAVSTSFAESRTGASLHQAGVAYVSLVPGTYPGALSAAITNRRTGAGTTARMYDGGLDPLPIPAETGDILDFAIDVGASEPQRFQQPVPLKMLPVVVRTEPGSGKRDVPLNLRVRIVFSEPMSRTSITGATVLLQQGGSPVPGEVALSADGLETTLAPASELLPETDYTIVVTGAIQDASGSPLATATTAVFTTIPDEFSGTGSVEVAILATGADVGGEYTAMLDGLRAFPVLLISSSSEGRSSSLANVTAGGHSVSLVMPANCSVLQPVRAVEVRAGQVTRVVFEVTCAPLVSAVRITAPTVGQGPAQYRVQHGTSGYWDYGGPSSYADFALLAPNDTVIRELHIDMSGGNWWHHFRLLDVPDGCTVQRNPSVQAELIYGDTLEIEFPVACPAALQRHP